MASVGPYKLNNGSTYTFPVRATLKSVVWVSDASAPNYGITLRNGGSNGAIFYGVDGNLNSGTGLNAGEFSVGIPFNVGEKIYNAGDIVTLIFE